MYYSTLFLYSPLSSSIVAAALPCVSLIIHSCRTIAKDNLLSFFLLNSLSWIFEHLNLLTFGYSIDDLSCFLFWLLLSRDQFFWWWIQRSLHIPRTLSLLFTPFSSRTIKQLDRVWTPGQVRGATAPLQLAIYSDQTDRERERNGIVPTSGPRKQNDAIF